MISLIKQWTVNLYRKKIKRKCYYFCKYFSKTFIYHLVSNFVSFIFKISNHYYKNLANFYGPRNLSIIILHLGTYINIYLYKN